MPFSLVPCFPDLPEDSPLLLLTMPIKIPTKSRLFSDSTLIAGLAFLSQLFVLVRFSQSAEFLPDGSDMQFYSDWGRRIANGQLTDGQAFYGLPGYAYILGTLYKLLGFDPFTIGLIQALLFSLTAVVIYRLALLAFGSDDQSEDAPIISRPRLVGWLAALGWIFFVPAETFATILMPTVWGVLAYWGCVAWLLRTREAAWTRPWFGIGLIIGILATMVATVFFLTPLVIAAMGHAVGKGKVWRQRLSLIGGAAGMYVAGILLGTSPAWLHNYFVAHERVLLSAHGGINLWIGNNPTATGYPKMPPGIRATQQGSLKDSISLAERTVGRPLTRAEVSAFWTGQARAFISGHFREWLRLLGRKVANFWNTYEYDDVSMIGRLRENGVTWPGLSFGPIAALGLAGMACVGWRARGPRWITAAVLLHMLSLLPVFITERYRVIAVPGLLLFAAWWIDATWRRVECRRGFEALGLAGFAVLAACLTSAPQSDVTLWSLDHYDAGLRALKSRDFETAQRRLELALRYTPTSADINCALGNLWLERNDRTRAKSYYRRALTLSPKHDGVLNNLGVLALDEKRWDLAERFFLGALQTEPNDAKTYFLIAKARLEQGNREGALAAAQEAVRLSPNQPQFVALLNELARRP